MGINTRKQVSNRRTLVKGGSRGKRVRSQQKSQRRSQQKKSQRRTQRRSQQKKSQRRTQRRSQQQKSQRRTQRRRQQQKSQIRTQRRSHQQKSQRRTQRRRQPQKSQIRTQRKRRQTAGSAGSAGPTTTKEALKGLKNSGPPSRMQRIRATLKGLFGFGKGSASKTCDAKKLKNLSPEEQLAHALQKLLDLGNWPSTQEKIVTISTPNSVGRGESSKPALVDQVKGKKLEDFILDVDEAETKSYPNREAKEIAKERAKVRLHAYITGLINEGTFLKTLLGDDDTKGGKVNIDTLLREKKLLNIVTFIKDLEELYPQYDIVLLNL